MSKLRADITYSHRLNSNITSEFNISDNINIDELFTNKKNNETDAANNSTEKNNEILIEEGEEEEEEEDDDDNNNNETDQINIENEFGEYLQGWADMLKEEELANYEDDLNDEDNSSDDENIIVNNIIHPAIDTSAKWILETLLKDNLN